jgi:signal transduction histidine kinase
MPASIFRSLSTRWVDLPIRYKGMVVIAIPCASLLLALLFFALLNREQQAAVDWTIHTQQVRLEAGRLLTALVDAETGMRGYLLTDQKGFLEPYQRALAVIPDSERALRRLVRDNPSQLKRIEGIESLTRKRLETMQSNVEMVGAPELTARLTRGKEDMDGLRVRIAEFEAEEERLELLRREELRAQQARFQWGLGLASVMALGGGMLAVFLFSRGIAQRLKAMETGAAEMAEGKAASWPSSGGDDEIGRLARRLQVAAEAVDGRRRVQEELVAANQELEAFTYSVSHDLRAPLRHISGFSKILAEEYGPALDPTAQRYLERIQNGTRQMGLLVDDLLNLARIGRQELRMQATGLNSLLDEVLAELKPETNDGRQVEWKIGRLPFVECDPALMKQVLYNLASNALKYTRPREQAVIEVSSTVKDGAAVIVCRDNGVGFSMKYADKLFGVFQRLHRSEDFEGTGIGLATVQRIIHKHGGRVWAEAELDKGATFYFTLEPTGQRQAENKLSTTAAVKHDGTSSGDLAG